MAGVSDSEGEEEEGGRKGRRSKLNYSQEQAELKSSFKAAAEVEGGGAEGEESLLVLRHKSDADKVQYEGRGMGVASEFHCLRLRRSESMLSG